MASFKAKFPVLQELFAKNHRGGGPFGPPGGARVMNVSRALFTHSRQNGTLAESRSEEGSLTGSSAQPDTWRIPHSSPPFPAWHTYRSCDNSAWRGSAAGRIQADLLRVSAG